MKTNPSRLTRGRFPTTRVGVLAYNGRQEVLSPIATPIKIFPLPPAGIFVLAAILIVHAAAAQQTKIPLAIVTLETEQVQLVANGDFQQQGMPVGGTFPDPPGWSRSGEMYVAMGSNMVATDQGIVAQGLVSATNPASGYVRSLSLQPNTEYVLSAYLWNLGDASNHVNTVVDLNDAPNEAQLALYASDPAADRGYFVYANFNTSTTGTNLTLRCFYDGLTGTGAAPQYHPVGAQWDNIAITRADLFPAPPHNAALAGTASQSSTGFGGLASRAIDGSTDGNYGSNSVTHNQPPEDGAWWEVDLGAMTPIGRICVWWRTDCCFDRQDDFTLLVLDGSRMEVFRETYPGRPPFPVYCRDLTPTVTGRIVRLEARVPRIGDGSFSLAEVQVFDVVPVPPSITMQPQSQTPLVGDNATFTVVASGTPPLSYQWRRNGFSIPGATNATYIIANSQAVDGGSYAVIVANGEGEVLSEVASLVADVPFLPGAPNFANAFDLSLAPSVVHGNNMDANAEPGEPRHVGKLGGSSVWYTWAATATGIATISTRGSTFDTLLAVYTGNTLSNLLLVTADEDRGGFYTSEVQFNAVDGATYRIAVDGFGGAQGSYVLWRGFEITDETVPIITTAPASLGVQRGSSATFSVAATGPGLTYQWLFGGAPIPGATGATLTMTNPQPADVGFYTVRVGNSFERMVESPLAYLVTSSDGRLAFHDKFVDFCETLDSSASRLAVAMLTVGSVIIHDITTEGAGPEPGPGCGILANTTWTRIEGELAADAFICIEARGMKVRPKLQGGEFLSGGCNVILDACDGRTGLDSELEARIIFPATNAHTYFYQVNTPKPDDVRCRISIGTAQLAITQGPQWDNTNGPQWSLTNWDQRTVLLTWCAPTTNYFVLQTTNGLISPPAGMAWTNLTKIAIRSNQFRNTVEVPTTGTRQFFRLQKKE